jgi:hypothetical protein
MNSLLIAYGKKTHFRFRGSRVYPTEDSCRFPLIVLQQTTQSFLATHNSVIPACPSIRQWEEESVLLALVIALLVVMGHVLLQGSHSDSRWLRSSTITNRALRSILCGLLSSCFCPAGEHTCQEGQRSLRGKSCGEMAYLKFLTSLSFWSHSNLHEVAS